jgi:6-phosphogluconolactonase
MINLKNKIFSSREDCFREFVKDISALLLGSVKKYGEASFAVSGGQTPQHVFPILARKHLPWGQVSITLVDERWVEPLHPDSNEGLARRLLMKGPAAAARFIGLKTSADNPFDGQENCEVALAGLCWPLDAIFLGMGEDGHIASLFPGEADWLYAPARTFPVATFGQRQARISLTPKALLDCRHIFLVITGSQKRATYDAAMQPGAVGELPVRLVLHQDQVPVTVYTLD